MNRKLFKIPTGRKFGPPKTKPSSGIGEELTLFPVNFEMTNNRSREPEWL